MSIDSNASLALIAERLGRTLTAIRKKLSDLGYKAESLGGYKVKEVAEMLSVPPKRVQYWVEEKMLLTKGGRITDSSLSKFLSDFPEKVPYETLTPDMRSWLGETGYKAQDGETKAAIPSSAIDPRHPWTASLMNTAIQGSAPSSEGGSTNSPQQSL
jgi:hypothetical protein